MINKNTLDLACKRFVNGRDEEEVKLYQWYFELPGIRLFHTDSGGKIWDNA
ncbi:MAG: hypothetical protein OEZ36_01590 [Spirochaetota bacterium]|nr:hypothetical protein [Spirochaetota bacterium]